MFYLKKYEKKQLYPGYTSSFTSDEYKYRLDNTDISLSDLKSLFVDYLDDFEDNFNVDILRKKIIEDVGEKMFDDLNIRFFLRSLELKLNISKDSAIDYFNDYITSLPRRYRKINLNDFSDYESEKFKKLKKIKSESKNPMSYKLLDIESPMLYEELTKMVLWVKNNNKKVLVTFDGRDTGGKGSISRFMMRNFFAAPLGRNIIYKDFGIPTKWQQRHWFHRYEKALPQEGQVVLMDRSWYNRAVNDPVMGYCTEKQYEKFMKDVIPFEDYIINDLDIIYVKFWLSIDKETQELRLKQRQESPTKFWKFSENDLKAMSKWDEFTEYIIRMFKNTSTSLSPWVIVNMDDKPLGWLNTLRYILTQVPYDNKNKKILKVYPEILYKIS